MENLFFCINQALNFIEGQLAPNYFKTQPNGLALSCGVDKYRHARNEQSPTTIVFAFAPDLCSPCKLHPAPNRQLERLVRQRYGLLNDKSIFSNFK